MSTMEFCDCQNCGTEGVLPMSDGKCPNCKVVLNEEKNVTEQSTAGTEKLHKKKRLDSKPKEITVDAIMSKKKKGESVSSQGRKNRTKVSRFHPSRILQCCLLDALYLGGVVFIISGGYGFLTGTGAERIGATLQWAGIAFLIGCVTGLRNL